MSEHHRHHRHRQYHCQVYLGRAPVFEPGQHWTGVFYGGRWKRQHWTGGVSFGASTLAEARAWLAEEVAFEGISGLEALPRAQFAPRTGCRLLYAAQGTDRAGGPAEARIYLEPDALGAAGRLRRRVAHVWPTRLSRT